MAGGLETDGRAYPKDLAVYDTVQWAIVFVFRNFGALLRVSVTPFLLSFGVAAVEASLSALAPGLHGTVTVLFFRFLLVAVLVPQATAWHRHTLLGNEPMRWFQFRFGAREARFCGFSLLGYVGLVTTGIVGLSLHQYVAEYAMAVQVLLAVIAVWFLSRFAAVLPASALGVRLTLAESYRSTRPYATRIMGIYIVMAFIMTTIGMGFDALGSVMASVVGATPWTTIVAETAPRAFFNLLSVGVSISLLSAIYRQIWLRDVKGPVLD